jgi:predicted peroxiredoxin
VPVRGMTLILIEASGQRFRAALEIAAAQVALGAPAHIFLSGAAVAVVRAPLHAEEDADHEAAGLPSLAALYDEALNLGVRITICQTGLHLSNTDASQLDARLAYGGLVSVLAGLGDDRLVVV